MDTSTTNQNWSGTFLAADGQTGVAITSTGYLYNVVVPTYTSAPTLAPSLVPTIAPTLTPTTAPTLAPIILIPVTSLGVHACITS